MPALARRHGVPVARQQIRNGGAGEQLSISSCARERLSLSSIKLCLDVSNPPLSFGFGSEAAGSPQMTSPTDLCPLFAVPLTDGCYRTSSQLGPDWDLLMLMRLPSAQTKELSPCFPEANYWRASLNKNMNAYVFEVAR
jgi:hypothetical protein